MCSCFGGRVFLYAAFYFWKYNVFYYFRSHMNEEEFFKLIPARQFFQKYAPTVRNYAHKRRGIDGNGKLITYSPEDKAAMKAAAKRLAEDLKKVKF